MTEQKTEITVQKTNGNLPWYQNTAQLNLLKRTYAKDASTDEFALFVGVAKRSGLDPFTKQVHFVKRGGQMTVQTGIDGYRAIAERTGTLAGIDDATYDSEENTLPKKATVTIYRRVGDERVPFTASARWSEYFPGEKMGFMWKKMPYLMLGKCAEALALRKAFPNDLSGLYTNEEMHQADKIIEVESTPIDSTKQKEDAKALMEKSDHKPIEVDNKVYNKEKGVDKAKSEIPTEEMTDKDVEDLAKDFGGKVVEEKEESEASKQMKAGMKKTKV